MRSSTAFVSPSFLQSFPPLSSRRLTAWFCCTLPWLTKHKMPIRPPQHARRLHRQKLRLDRAEQFVDAFSRPRFERFQLTDIIFGRSLRLLVQRQLEQRQFVVRQAGHEYPIKAESIRSKWSVRFHRCGVLFAKRLGGIRCLRIELWPFLPEPNQQQAESLVDISDLLCRLTSELKRRFRVKSSA